MYRFLPAPVLGLLLLSSITISTILYGIPMFILAVFKIAIPNEAWRHWWTQRLVFTAETWIHLNNLMISAALPTRFEFRGLDDPRLKRDGRYLVASNHQTWADVLVLQRILIPYAPFLRFFIKQELIYLPVLGMTWWALDMPFMKRYSPAKLAKHPELRGKDLETTRRACDHFRRGPISIMNFIEGTRFSPEKRDKYGSPHLHLLKPKAGGIAAVLDAFSGDLDTLVDVTIVYSKPGTDFWDFLTGRVRKVLAEVRVEEIPVELRRGNYSDDAVYRERVQTWVRELWERKDERITALAAECSQARPAAALS
jgi:1-acyl-sn-glycerol-3-phosphate acyltransferase